MTAVDRKGRIARLVSPVVGVVGLAILVTGTFLPWLRSGRSARNSYQASGAIRRLVAPHGPLGALFAVWPLIAIAAAASAATYLLGLRRSSAALALGTALVSTAAAFNALKTSSNAYASVVVSGPRTTAIGGVLVSLALVIHLVVHRVVTRRTFRSPP